MFIRNIKNRDFICIWIVKCTIKGREFISWSKLMRVSNTMIFESRKCKYIGRHQSLFQLVLAIACKARLNTQTQPNDNFSLRALSLSNTIENTGICRWSSVIGLFVSVLSTSVEINKGKLARNWIVFWSGEKTPMSFCAR